MRSRVWVVIAALVVSGVGLRRAGAECAMPRVVVAPGTGAVLPPNPVLFVFVPARHGARTPVAPDVEAEVNGKLISVDVSTASEAPAVVVWRVRLLGAKRGVATVRVNADWQGELALRYEIDPAWTPPGPRQAVVAASERRSFAWPCSHEDAQIITPSVDAPVYRVEVAASLDDYAKGVRRTFYFPRTQRDYFSGWIGEHPPELVLGHANCFGDTIPTGAATDRIAIVPVYADDVVVPPAPTQPPAGPAVESPPVRSMPRPRALGPHWSEWLLAFARLYGVSLLTAAAVAATLLTTRHIRAYSNAIDRKSK